MKSEFNRQSEINDRAADWVLKNDRALSAAEQDAFTDWISECPEHREAYMEHSFAWDELARLAGLQNTDYSPVVPDLLGVARAPWYREYRKLKKWTIALPLAASIALVAGYFLLAQFPDPGLQVAAGQSLVVNQILQQRLEDGSVVDLNKGAVIEAHITRKERLVKLLSGEANFNVEKDSSRPFIVEVSGVRIRAVGTVFNVRKEKEKVDVVVTEGTVAVLYSQTTMDQSLPALQKSLVRENFRAVVNLESANPRVTVDPVKEEDMDAELLWQPRLIDFENAPLSEIVDEFNRRNPLRIEIKDEDIGSLRFTSIFWSNNVESFLRLLENNYGVSTRVVGDNRIELRRSREAL